MESGNLSAVLMFSKPDDRTELKIIEKIDQNVCRLC